MTPAIAQYARDRLHGMPGLAFIIPVSPMFPAGRCTEQGLELKQSRVSRLVHPCGPFTPPLSASTEEGFTDRTGSRKLFNLVSLFALKSISAEQRGFGGGAAGF